MSSDTKRRLTYVGWAVAIIAAALLLWEVFRPHERTINVSNLTWSRTISIDRWTTVEERTWHRYAIPSDGRFTHRRWEYHYTDRVLVGHTSDSDGNGTPIYEDVDVYDYRYYYDIEEWRYARDVTTCGTWETEPYWGEITLSGPTGDHDVGKERESGRGETFRVVDEGGIEHIAARDLWDQLRPGDKRILTVHIGLDGYTIEDTRR